MSGGPIARFFGGLLVAVGLLIAVTSGGCSLFVAASFLRTATPSMLVSLLFMVAVVGGLPFGIGVAMIVGGRAMMRSSDGRGPVPPTSYGEDAPDDPAER